MPSGKDGRAKLLAIPLPAVPPPPLKKQKKKHSKGKLAKNYTVH
jgi:hypothetical protein